MKDEMPQVRPLTSFKGDLKYLCCGIESQYKSKDFESNVNCPYCGKSYNLELSLRTYQDSIYPKGTMVRLREKVNVHVGSKDVELKKGVYRIAVDPFFVLGNLENQSLIEIVSPCPANKSRILLASVSNSLLELEGVESDGKG